jgi:hypothetical protein
MSLAELESQGGQHSSGEWASGMTIYRVRIRERIDYVFLKFTHFRIRKASMMRESEKLWSSGSDVLIKR